MTGFGLLTEWGVATQLSLILAVTLACGFVGAPLILWTAGIAALAYLFGVPTVLWILIGVPVAIMNLPPVRKFIVSAPIMNLFRALNFMPVISETERIALEAGATWVEGELFSGKPNFKRINAEKYQHVNAEEKAFLDGPVEKLCNMVRDWEIYQTGDLPKEVWDFIKKEKLFGMIVPKKYGGLEFSAIANSEVVAKLSSRSIPLGITVMVPNSLGPAELINHYGTQAQKDYYLPRLANGEEIPCFALTEPEAGSDAGSIASTGEVFKGDDGKLYVRLNWDKRYITLAAISTIVGLAIKLRDPQNLLGKGEDLGITCMLVPSKTKGVVLGKRHNPMGIPFFNCPTRGENVVVSIDQIIGGKDGAGRGWQMLMECLAAGRSISLPAQSTSLVKVVAHVTSAYGFIRRQFGMPIAKFEGIEEKLARITGLAYIAEAARVYTCGAVDSGIKPAVVSAIAKYNATEIGRIVINDGMDILGGAAISRGPKNIFANAYIANPIGITVEGANILTRTMIIFGQGAIRCHPYAYKELKAITEGNLSDFDKYFWGHIGFVIRNMCRSVLLSLTRGHLAVTPSGITRKYYRKLAWSSASFAILADIAMGSLGGKLKLKEKLTGRYADVLMWMYYATAALRRFEAEGRKKEHEAVLEWSMKYSFARIQEGFDGIFSNFDVPVLWAVFRGPIGFWSRLNRFSDHPSDELGHRIVSKMSQPGAFRDSLTEGIYLPKGDLDPQGAIERAFKLSIESDAILKKINSAIRAKKLPKERPSRLIERALALNIISRDEGEILKAAEKARFEAISVDSFDLDEFQTGLLESSRAKLA